jgi:hypothetical protein
MAPELMLQLETYRSPEANKGGGCPCDSMQSEVVKAREQPAHAQDSLTGTAVVSAPDQESRACGMIGMIEGDAIAEADSLSGRYDCSRKRPAPGEPSREGPAPRCGPAPSATNRQ